MSYLKKYAIYFATQRDIEQEGYEIRFLEVNGKSRKDVKRRIEDHKDAFKDSLHVPIISAFRILSLEENDAIKGYYDESEIDIPPYVESIEEFSEIFNVITSEADTETHLMS